MKPNLPINFVQQMKELLKEEYETYEKSFEQPRYYGLRVNTSKISVEDFLNEFPYKLIPVPWCSNGFYYNGEDPVSKHPFYYGGLYYLQEPSAMLPAEVLEIEEGDIVLDGCAAPGGKSTELAVKLNNTGLLISNDISASRAQGLLKNLELFGIMNAYVTSEDLSKLAERYANTFDKILIDAPCSGEGMFRKDTSLITSYKERGSEYYAPIQKAIVKAAVSMLKEGGKLVYSTCTFSKCEDEEVVEYMLSLDKRMHLLPIRSCEGFVDGFDGLKECKRLFPHRIKGEGHFVAYAQKGTESKKEVHLFAKQDERLPEEAQNFLKLINSERFKGSIRIINDKVVLTPIVSFDSAHLRVLRSGLLMGTLKNERFEPSTTLALALKPREFAQVLNLSKEDNRVIKYLKGETISPDSANLEGWALVCVENQPLGFGKISHGLFKNHYDKNWRML